MQKAMDRDSKSPSAVELLKRQCSGFNTLRRVSLTLHGEKRTLGNVFRMPKKSRSLLLFLNLSFHGALSSLTPLRNKS